MAELEPPSILEDEDFLEFQYIPFLERQLYQARQKLKWFRGGRVMPAQESDQARNEVDSSHTV